MLFLLFTIITAITSTWGKSPSVCDIIDMKSCHGVSKQQRRSSSLSLPSPASAASTNPANVSFDRGVGVEFLHQSGNPLGFNLSSGTGKMGGALISHNLENSFFGNRVPEIDDVLLVRLNEKKQYKPQKINLALGRRLIKKKSTSFDLGLLLKRNEDTKRINPGIGASGRLGPLSYGASLYQDDIFLKLENYINPYTNQAYSNIYLSDTYTERFRVYTYTLGLKFKNLAVDAGLIRTKYDFYEDDTKIILYSAALSYKNFLLNFALRNEFSPSLQYVDGILVEGRKKNEIYTGIQSSFGRHLIMGVQYNFFLLREISFTGTVFF